MSYYCNPLNLPYRYQFMPKGESSIVFREAADPSLILFKEEYYLFPSMTGGFYVSNNLLTWEFYPLPKKIPVYDYAPDVRVAGNYIYFSASKLQDNCSFYRTKNPRQGDFEEIKGTFPFWDPNLFLDDDGKMYFYWGCSNIMPIYGIELNSHTLQPKGDKISLIKAHEDEYGYERTGDDHIPPKSPKEITLMEEQMLNKYPDISDLQKKLLKRCVSNAPYVEGAWVTKHNGKYYLQYAVNGTEFNVYADGVYVSDKPLGPYTPAKNNPYSYKPGGFINGAGHGSTLEDKQKHYWHISSMRISCNHNFERRLGLWKAGFDKDGELFCDQRYGDWPVKIENSSWTKPEWMLLSYRKRTEVSSGKGAEYITDENIRTWWKAENNLPGQWVILDLGKAYDVRAIQINFADDNWEVEIPKDAQLYGEPQTKQCYLDMNLYKTRWLLEGSINGKSYTVIEDKTNTQTDLPHDFIVKEKGILVRYLKLTIIELPYKQTACISGIRVFGIGNGEYPNETSGLQVKKTGALDIVVSWDDDQAVGHNILWGYAPDKLYHSYMVYGKHEQNIGALIKGRTTYLRVDAFNENGVTEGTKTIKID